ncbi:MAG: four-carbon acid sugar kinase family protein [Lachnospiraceae bacterium]|nr:four-carbon acid sugar kinase family protein [Lachnospiraceae bacterium]
MKRQIRIGCLADDFTGGSDAASFLKKGGMETILINGIPRDEFEIPEGVDAVVVALKSRTEKTSKAVADSVKAVKWLLSYGAQYIYIKYCSTFDSTPLGNIGPICDAVLDLMGEKYTVLCPSLPANGRTVKDGVLYVDDVPLAESPMKNHPLTPMWDSYIPELMRRQSRYACKVIRKEDYERDSFAPMRQATREKRYLIPDYVTDLDGEMIVRRFRGTHLYTGGSGLLEHLAGENRKSHIPEKRTFSKKKSLIVVGSCSVMTQKQVRNYLTDGGKGLEIRPEAIRSGEQSLQTIWKAICESETSSFMLYSSGSAGKMLKAEHEEDAALLENMLAEAAACAVKNGYESVISAGGETSGAVVKKLSYEAFWIRESVAPGVPVLTPISESNISLVLKSGNFGDENFFFRAMHMTGGDV